MGGNQSSNMEMACCQRAPQHLNRRKEMQKEVAEGHSHVIPPNPRDRNSRIAATTVFPPGRVVYPSLAEYQQFQNTNTPANSAQKLPKRRNGNRKTMMNIQRR